MLWREQWITSVYIWLELTPNGVQSSFIASEREKRVTWEEMKEDKYMEGQESFDISPFYFKPLSSDQGDEDEADVEDRDNDFKTDWMKNIVQ